MHKLLKFLLVLSLISLITTTMTSKAGNFNKLDILIGQKLIFGFKGTDLSNDTQIVEDIKNHHIGGVILFDYDSTSADHKRNIIDRLQLKKLVTQLKNSSDIPLFIAIDAEGGYVNRLKPQYGFEKTHTAKYLGDQNDPDFTIKESEKISKALSDMGINLNFAPIVDLDINPANPVITKYERSFSSAPEIVVEQSLAFITAMHKYDVLTCIKHFPGHGSSAHDSHFGMTDITKTWTPNELIPFESIIKKNKCDMIMTGHLINKQFDEHYPATLSKNMIKGILRDQLGYKGVIISDDMQMKAVADYYGLKESILLAINADIDMFIFGNNIGKSDDLPGEVIKIIKELLNEKKITYYQLLKSYRRIIKLKKKINK